MIPKFNHCCLPKPTGVSCCPRQTPSLGNAVPESVRVMQERCKFAYVTTYIGASPNYDPMNGMSTMSTTIVCGAPGIQKITVPVVSIVPLVDVGSVSASTTSRQRALEVISIGSDPYNPATRFAQFFPPAPIPYICPERIPNNDPKPSTAPCLPIQFFMGSAQLSTMEGVSTVVGISTLAGRLIV